MSRKPKALPLTVICKTQPTVIEQDGSWIVVFVPDAPKSRRSAKKSVKVATACKDVPRGVQDNQSHVPTEGTSKTLKNAGKTAFVPTGVQGDVPSEGTSETLGVPTGVQGVHDVVPLEFDDDNGLIRWGKKAVKLGTRGRSFVETLWNKGVEHVVELCKIEEAVYFLDENNVEKLSVPMNTIKQTVKRLRRDLREARFPYEVETVKKISEKNFSLHIQGFRLILKRCT